MLCCNTKFRRLTEPIVVVSVREVFRVIDGEKRWRAGKKIGLTRNKAMIYDE